MCKIKNSDYLKINTPQRLEGCNMIIMDFKADNFYAFNDFKLNMSYPKKMKDSLISGEYLKHRPNFRYKKVNIIMGGNATGKTSIGNLLMDIFNFVVRRKESMVTNSISDKTRPATFSMDYVTDDLSLYRFVSTFIWNESDEPKWDINVNLMLAQIAKADNYESCVKKLKTVASSDSKENVIIFKEMSPHFSWYFMFPHDDTFKVIIGEKDDPEYLKILDITLRSLDPSIKSVERLDEVDNSFVIKWERKSVIVQEGETIKTGMFSSGTREGLKLADTIYAVKKLDHQFHYCDEQFAYIHSEVEKAFLVELICCLKEDSQLFFTTHNTDILDLNLPKHSFTFLKKDKTEGGHIITALNAADFLKKNTDSLRRAVENDMFSTTPSTTLIESISEEDCDYDE